MSSTKSVCVLTSSFPRHKGDEASLFVGRLVEAFSECGLRGVVICPRDDNELRNEPWGNFTVHRFQYGLLTKGSLAYGQGILTNIKNHPLCLLQVPLFLFQLFFQAWKMRREWEVVHANWIVCAIPAFLLSLCTGRSFVVTLRGVDMKLLRVPLLGRILGFLLKKASHVVSVNLAFLSELERLHIVDTAKVSCIPNGASLESFSNEEREAFLQERGLEQEKRYILFVSRVIPLKRVELLIEALALQKNSDVELLLVGRVQPDYGKRLKELAESLDCEQRVRFEGAVDAKEIALYHSVATLYATASSWEGRSNSLAEALVAGTPVVVSDIAGHSELVDRGVHGVLVSRQTPESYAKALNELLADRELCKRYADAGKERMKAFTWQAAAAQYEALFSANTVV